MRKQSWLPTEKLHICSQCVAEILDVGCAVSGGEVIQVSRNVSLKRVDGCEECCFMEVFKLLCTSVLHMYEIFTTWIFKGSNFKVNTHEHTWFPPPHGKFNTCVTTNQQLGQLGMMWYSVEYFHVCEAFSFVWYLDTLVNV